MINYDETTNLPKHRSRNDRFVAHKTIASSSRVQMQDRCDAASKRMPQDATDVAKAGDTLDSNHRHHPNKNDSSDAKRVAKKKKKIRFASFLQYYNPPRER